MALIMISKMMMMVLTMITTKDDGANMLTRIMLMMKDNNCINAIVLCWTHWIVLSFVVYRLCLL